MVDFTFTCTMCADITGPRRMLAGDLLAVANLLVNLLQLQSKYASACENIPTELSSPA